MRRTLKIIGTLIPVFTTTGVSTTFLVKDSISSNEPKGSRTSGGVLVKDDDSIGGMKVFPEIFQQNYYQLIHVKNGQPYITPEAIAKIVKDVLKGSTYSGGDIHWAYKYKDNARQEVKITFVWKPNINALKPCRKTYIVKVNK